MALKKIESREYKVMVDPRIFDILPVGLKFLKNELALIAKTVGHVKLKKSFKLDQSSTVRFLDTKDFFLANLNYIFRAKQPSEPNAKIEYTLKYRTGDRYLSAYRQLSTAAGTKGKKKFEEDIGADKNNSFIS